MDSARPPQIVVEQVAPCRDAAAARAQLTEALAPSLAPTGSWTVRARFEGGGGRTTVRGEVVNAEAVTVASRTLSTRGSDCVSLAKGLGVWASLVLDAEVDRARSASAPPEEPHAEAQLPPPPPEESAWPVSTAVEPPRPREADLFLSHDKDERSVEFGLSGFVMGGTGGGAIVGPAAYAVFEAAHGFFLRPTVFGGHSVGGLSVTAEAPATFLASRFDACARVPGLYREGRGLQLDLCGGVELGFSLVDSGVVASPAASAGGDTNRTLPFVALGPSMGLRGELGGGLSAIVRGVGNVSLLRDTLVIQNGASVTPAIFGGRAEVGLSWSLR